MFKNGDRSYNVNLIPRRLYQVVKILASSTDGKLGADELSKLYQQLGKSDSYNGLVQWLEDIGIITISEDGVVSLVPSVEDVSSIEKFRYFCNSKVYRNENSLFCAMTICYLQAGDEMCTNTNLTSNQSSKFYRSVDGLVKNSLMANKAILSYREWAPFLGVGTCIETTKQLQKSDKIFALWPNMALALQDCINLCHFSKDEKILAATFLERVEEYCPLLKTCIINKRVPLAVANGLRSLHDSGFIRLLRERDAQDIYFLPGFPNHGTQPSFTHVQMLKGKVK